METGIPTVMTQNECWRKDLKDNSPWIGYEKGEKEIKIISGRDFFLGAFSICISLLAFIPDSAICLGQQNSLPDLVYFWHDIY
jgi:hypothetical protein